MTTFEVRTDDGAVLAGAVDSPPGSAQPANKPAPTVVLAHGWTCTRASWQPVAERLVAAGHSVVRYDQRAHGASTAGADPPSIQRLGADLAAVLEAVDASDAVVAGHSMGGMTVLAFALDHPELAARRVSELVLVAAAAAAPLTGRWRTAAALRLTTNARLERLLAGRAGPALMRPTLGRRLPRAGLVATRDEFVATPPAVRRAWLEAISTMDNLERLGAVALPTTIISGSRDRLCPPRCSAALAAGIPGARLIEIKGAGHVLAHEAPDIVAGVITERTLGLPPSPPS